VNETLKLINRRMSLRRYAQREVAPEDRDRILESAMRAPTAGNMMLYSIIEIADPTSRARLAETCGHSFIEQAPLVLLFLADMQRWFDYYEINDVPAHRRQEGLDYRTPELSDLLMSSCDALIAAQNSVIAAESLGIGSCYVGDIMGQAETHRELFDLPPWAFPIALLCYGHYPRDLPRRRASRFDRRFICFRDRYTRFAADDFREMLSGIEAQFADVLRKSGMNLAQMTYRGFTGSESRLEEARSVRLLLHDWRAES